MNSQTKTFYLQKEYILKGNFTTYQDLPRIKKISLNTGVAKASHDKSTILPSMVALKLISGAHPVYTRAKKSIASFKLIKGSVIGAQVTLRRESMGLFLEKFVHILLPRLEHTRLPKNLSSLSHPSKLSDIAVSFGLDDCILFPELEDNYDIFYNLPGLQVTCLTNLRKRRAALSFLTSLHVPLFSPSRS